MIKKIVKKFVPQIVLDKIKKDRFIKYEYNKLNRGEYSFNKKIKLISANKDYTKQFDDLLGKIKIEKNDDFYFYNIDYTNRLFTDNNVISNMPIDYSLCMKSLESIRKSTKQNSQCLEIIDSINMYINRVIDSLIQYSNKRNNQLVSIFRNIITKDSSSFDESLQRILLYNQLLWQTGHRLVGLGRLDKILINYYKDDIKKQIITKDEAYNMIKQFLTILNKDYCFKSNVLLGDTGQLIILAGLEDKSNYICNDLTYLFIKAVKELQLPDPKILLRICEKTPRKLVGEALNCVKTGIGSPLFANDKIIIESLISAGYDSQDAYNYVTSACWEPLILGKSLDQNNLTNIIFLEPLNRVLKSDMGSIKNFETLLDLYEKQMKDYIKEIIDYINKIKFQEDPLMSLFIKDCIKNNKDISLGGAKYNNLGLLSLGLSNTVNSLLILKEYVFDEKKYTLVELNQKRLQNCLPKLPIKEKFGSDSPFVINLTNRLMSIASENLKKYKNNFGGNYKFGLSSPNYIISAKQSEASFDGRKQNTAYGVHISSDDVLAYTELVQFAGKLDYSINKYNGNVVDFFVSPSFIDNNYEKFLDFLILSIKSGFFEMQMNVVSSKILIDAKKNPEKFPNLIVRVWGFSSYFKDLPDEYKDVLIERALKSEGKV